MPMLPILIVAVVLLADGGLRLFDDVLLPPWQVMGLSLAPVAVVLACTALGIAWCRRRLDRGQTPRPIFIAERLVRSARAIIIIVHAISVLALGLLDTVRRAIGDLVLVDELVTILPPLVGVMGLWWIYYPIERRMHEALLIRRLDLGRPIHPTPSRLAWVLLQVRMQVLLLLVPILLIVAVDELLDRLLPRMLPDAGAWLGDAMTVVTAFGIFALSPLLARALLPVEPLPPGPVRDDLGAVCTRHRVSVRDILVWKTGGSIINAAVMGLVAPLRYVLLTDALLETMRREEVAAVMAHEIGHVRRHHMPWLLVSLLATIALSFAIVFAPIAALDAMEVTFATTYASWAEAGIAAGQLALALVAFGWVCRRFERQADTFAVQHLSGMERRSRAGDGLSIDETAVDTVRGALTTIARLNTVDPGRRSWRHGSIAWRQAYLGTLIGRPALGLPIDRLVRRIKAAALAVLVLTALGLFLMEAMGDDEPAALSSAPANYAVGALADLDTSPAPPTRIPHPASRIPTP
jgi:Zn-dependent protease with chaperone function